MSKSRSCPRGSAGIAAAVCALMAAFGLPLLLRWDGTPPYRAAWLAVAALLFFGCKALLQEAEVRLRRWALGFGFLFALCQLAGARLDAADTVGGLADALLLLLCAAATAPALGAVFAAMARLCRGRAAVSQPRGKSPRGGSACFWTAFAVILLCWLPVYLAYYPGMFNYDVDRQLTQALTGAYNTNMPLIHTLWVGALYRLGQALGNVNVGVALYTAVQCMALAAAIAYGAAYLRRLGCPLGWVCLCVAVFGLLPCFSLMAMCTTKDLFFGAAVLVLMIRLHQLYRDPAGWRQPRGYVPVAVCVALICLLRSNGVSVGVTAALAALLFLRDRESRRRALACLLGGLLLFGGVTVGFRLWLKPGGSGLRESMSVPLSQLSRVYALTEERGETLPEKEELLGFIPDARRYQRHLSDGVKYNAAVGAVNLRGFLSLWARLGARYPAAYLDAFLYLNKGYWHLDDLTHLDIYAERGDHGYLETKAHEGYGVERHSLLPGLMTRLDALFVENEYTRVPLLSTIVEPAFWCWLLWFAVALCWLNRRRDGLFCSLMLLGLYASMLIFGPCAYMRYAYPLALCAPFLLGLCLIPNKEGQRS